MTDCSISVIIPAYNVEKYLVEALDSINDQEQLPDEVILIDDGSIDRTREVAEGYRFSVPYQVVSIANNGQGNARNLGVSLASSEYVYFFDSDDLLTKNFISSLKKQIKKNQFPDIILFSGESFNDSEYLGNRWIKYRRGFSGIFQNRTEFLDHAFLHTGLFCSPCMYVSKRILWKPSGLKFGPYYLEDEAIFFDLLFACRTFLVIDEVFFLRRNREGSTMTMVANSKHVNGALDCIQSVWSLYCDKSLSSKEQFYVRKRLETNSIVYILMARSARVELQISVLLSVIWKIKSFKFTFKVLFFVFKLDNISWLLKFILGSKKFLNFTRSGKWLR